MKNRLINHNKPGEVMTIENILNINDQTLNDPNRQSYWLKRWQALTTSSRGRPLRKGLDQFAYWNNLADILEKVSEKDRMKNRLRRTMHFLTAAGINLKGLKVLDIGAGMGDFSIAFTTQGATVTALEPAIKIVNRLEKRILNAGVAPQKIQILKQPWEEIDLVKTGLAKQFDLVFASLNPGVRTPAALEKMIEASRRWCLLCDVAAGKQTSPGKTELWSRLFEEALPARQYNIIYPLNYLYTGGYATTLQTWSESWEEKLSRPEAVQYFLDFFSLYLEPTSSVINVISKYVDQNSQGNFYEESYQVRLGLLLWNLPDL